MSRHNRTAEQNGEASVNPATSSIPGLVMIFTGGHPAATILPLQQGELTLGRDDTAFAAEPDICMSRQHARILFDGSRFSVMDLDSRNGTMVDGVRLRPQVPHKIRYVVRLGDSLFLPLVDVRPFHELGIVVKNGRVEGPALQRAMRAVASAAQLSKTLHINGESGAGKEELARAFHQAGGGGPFVGVNCATISATIAERLLFGAKRGAFSGADADAEGYVQAAERGTLFLDEIAELSLEVQSKLLRLLESHEVLPVGATRARPVQIRICTATHRDLRAQVAGGRLREDLYFRIASPLVTVPPLRQRCEEIPWLLQLELARCAPQLTLHNSLVEAALLRPWPGNVRELLAATRSAAHAALGNGSPRVTQQHLGDTAGLQFAEVSPAKAIAETPTAPPDRAVLEAALRSAAGNVSAAARILGMHRTQLRRWLTRYGLSVAES